MTRRLHLLRHATTEDARPGHPDRDRRLTEQGHREAREQGRWLRADGDPGPGGHPVELVWCSPAQRVRETVTGLGLGLEPVVLPGLYQAGVDEVLALVAGCDPEVGSLLVVGHNPAVAGVAWELCPPEAPEQEVIARRFPPATLISFDLTSWDDPGPATRTVLRLP